MTVSKKELRALKPLIDARQPYTGEVWIAVDGTQSYVICAACGAKDDRSMIRKHAKGCAYVAFFKAKDALAALLGKL